MLSPVYPGFFLYGTIEQTGSARGMVLKRVFLGSSRSPVVSSDSVIPLNVLRERSPSSEISSRISLPGGTSSTFTLLRPARCPQGLRSHGACPEDGREKKDKNAQTGESDLCVSSSRLPERTERAGRRNNAASRLARTATLKSAAKFFCKAFRIKAPMRGVTIESLSPTVS